MDEYEYDDCFDCDGLDLFAALVIAGCILACCLIWTAIIYGMVRAFR